LAPTRDLPRQRLSGVIVGDSIVYWLGHEYGEAILRRPMIARLMTPARVEKARAFFRDRGALAVIIARNIAGVRFHLPPWRASPAWATGSSFSATGISGSVSVPFYFYLGYRGAGKHLDTLKEHFPTVIAGLGGASSWWSSSSRRR
jgi:membrane protein DedA with SNARE-associated domain